ncbi:hypothetical protein ACFORJ_09550 [Corynebacterium hansenii]|uniref:SMI1/KNR4 family protein n=1 Tax=Corynebacterium hansenii TaxID=394964 RepID=A0ABV7ZQ59_9CORY|nr:hypothetical protein [Corynebacterium hansenii]WJZ00995.1 hypothetical protein CHAN_12045 [Corynebacterium hansenii]
MELLDRSEVFASLAPLDRHIKDKGKIPAIDTAYTAFIHQFEPIALTPDIDLCGYQEALQVNGYARDSGLPEDFWLIGRSGQGDEWLLSQRHRTVFFFDHDKGGHDDAGAFTDFRIDFTDFVRAGLVLAQLEKHLDAGDDIAPLKNETAALLGRIHPGLFDAYPYGYFDSDC